MSRLNTPTYKTLNWPEYNKALKRRGSLTIWFDPDMACAAKPTGKRGRQAVTAGAVARNEALRATKYLGRALWRPLSAASCGCACRAMDGADTTAEAAQRPKCTV